MVASADVVLAELQELLVRRTFARAALVIADAATSPSGTASRDLAQVEHAIAVLIQQHGPAA